MRCYFLRGGQIAGVEILPLGLSDEEAIAKAHAQGDQPSLSFRSRRNAPWALRVEA